MGESRVYVAIEYPTCVHVRVEDARSARSAVQLARRCAERHYGTRVGSYVSSGGQGYPSGAVDYTYVFSAPDLEPYRDVWELTTVDRGRVTSVTVFATEDEARAALDRHGDRRTAYVRGPVTQYRRAAADA